MFIRLDNATGLARPTVTFRLVSVKDDLGNVITPPATTGTVPNRPFDIIEN